jgi:hypothetical protein
MIANQRHRSTRLHSGELYFRKTIQPLETLVAADLGLAGLGYDPHQFGEIATLKHNKAPFRF